MHTHHHATNVWQAEGARKAAAAGAARAEEEARRERDAAATEKVEELTN